MNSIIDAMPVHADVPAQAALDDLPSQLRRLAAEEPHRPAVADPAGVYTRAELVSRAHQIANRLIAGGLRRGGTVAALAANSRDYVALLAGTLAAGGCLVPLPTSATAQTLALMIEDCDTRFVFADEAASGSLPELPRIPAANRILLDGAREGWQGLSRWIADMPDDAPDVRIGPDDAFNIIYSSGTTGRPKGIVHDHRLRAHQCNRFINMGFKPGCVTLLATPIYSNTTMVALLPTLHNGGLAVLTPSFDAAGYLALAQEHRATHTMLVPVQYRRILAEPSFDATDLSAFRMKMSAGAPLRATLIRELMERWPGNLVEIYGMTEGGGATMLDCAAFPDKWESVGRAGEGTILHVIDEGGNVLPPGEAGELVGRSGSMMRGYYKQPQASEEMLWRDADGRVFYRSGDMARIDADGFVHLLDRRKDMILSGGFNIFAEDLEKVLLEHEDVADAAVVAVPSEIWGETPLGLVVLREGATVDEEGLRGWANERLGRTQRLARVEKRAHLPRNAMGKLMKRELRAPYWPAGQ